MFDGASKTLAKMPFIKRQKDNKKNVENAKSNGLNGNFPKKLKIKATITKNDRQYIKSLYIVVLFKKSSINLNIFFKTACHCCYSIFVYHISLKSV